MKKLSFFLMAMILCYAPALRAADVTETIAMKKFGGLSTSAYENVTKTGTSDKGTEMVAYAFNPNTGQVRGSKTTIAGASITSEDDSKNWSLYNTQAMPGAIKKITVTQTATGSNKFQNNLYVALGTTNQGAVTTVTGAQKNTTGTATEFTFEIDETQGYTYFKLLSNVKFTSGSVAGVVVTVTYAEAASNPDAVKYTVTANVNDPAMGTVSGAGEYEEGKTATLTANANAGYRFVNWSNGSTDNPLKITVTEDVEITANFEAIPPMTCAEAAAAASGATVVLNPFDVVAVVKGAGYIYIKDESGVNLIYDFNLDDQLKAGDHVEGFVGVSSPYNGLPELKPSVAFADLTVTPGTAPEPTLFTTVPVKADVNKYVKFENVTLTANATFTTESASNATMVVNGTNVTLRNAFKLAATLSKDKTYDIVGFVAIYNSDIQVYFLSATEVADLEREEYTISWSVNGTIKETKTVLEGDKLVLPAAPEAPEACSEKVFVGWTAAEEVNADGSDIEWVTAATVPAGDATYYAVFALQEGEGSLEEGNVTMKYAGSTTTNMAEGNNAEKVGLDANVWNVTANKGGHSSYPGLNKDGTIRLYRGDDTGTNSIIVSNEAVTIQSLTITCGTLNKVKVLVNGNEVIASNGSYAINASSFVVTNGNTSGTTQVHIASIVINYTSGASATYTDYSTTCEEVVDPETPTSVDNIEVSVSAVKAIENGQLIVIKNGVKYNALGQVIK